MEVASNSLRIYSIGVHLQPICGMQSICSTIHMWVCCTRWHVYKAIAQIFELLAYFAQNNRL